MKKNHPKNQDQKHSDSSKQIINACQLQIYKLEYHQNFAQQLKQPKSSQLDEKLILFKDWDKDYLNKITSSQAFLNRYQKIQALLKSQKTQEKQEMVSYKQLCAFYQASLKKQSFKLELTQIGLIAKMTSKNQQPHFEVEVQIEVKDEVEVLIIDRNFFIQNYAKPFMKIYQELNLKDQDQAANKIIQIISEVVQFGRNKYLSRTYKEKNALTYLEPLAGWFYQAKGNQFDHSIRIAILAGLIKQVFFVLFSQNLLNPQNFQNFINKQPQYLEQRNKNMSKYRNRLHYCLQAIIPQRLQISMEEAYKQTCLKLKNIVDLSTPGSYQLMKTTLEHIKNKTYDLKGYQKCKKQDLKQFYQDQSLKDIEKQSFQNLIKNKKIKKLQADKQKRNKKKKQKRKNEKQGFKRPRPSLNQEQGSNLQQSKKSKTDKKKKKVKTNQTEFSSNLQRIDQNRDILNKSVTTFQLQNQSQNQFDSSNVFKDDMNQQSYYAKRQKRLFSESFDNQIRKYKQNKSQSQQPSQKFKNKNRNDKKISQLQMQSSKRQISNSKDSIYYHSQHYQQQMDQFENQDHEQNSILLDSYQYDLRHFRVKKENQNQIDQNNQLYGDYIFPQKDEQQNLNFIYKIQD